MNSVDRPAFRRISSSARSRGSSIGAMKSRFRTNKSHVMVAAHRGHWDPLPENSLAAIRAASRWDTIEIDVRLDRLGAPVLMHDATLLRMTGLPTPVADIVPEERRMIRLRSAAGGTSAQPTEEHVPSLDEAFAVLDGTGAVFDLDVKRPEDIEIVAHAVASLGCQDLATLKLDVKTVADVAALVDLERRYDIMVTAKMSLRSKADLALVVALREADVAAVEIDFTDVNLLASATAFASDLIRFGTSTMDERHFSGLSDSRALHDPRDVWGRLVSAGIRWIMTDRPMELSRYLLTR